MHIILSYYFTKPLQGELFHNFRDIIMVRVSPFTIPQYTFSYTSRELVGKQFHQNRFPWVMDIQLKKPKICFKIKMINMSTRAQEVH